MMENRKVCKWGLENIWVDNAAGDIRMCGWTRYYLGNLQDHTIEELWHGEKAEIFRKTMLDGSYSFCHSDCPHLANNTLSENLTEYKVPEYPKFCSLSYERQCNYVCQFCRKERYIPEANEEKKIEKIEKELQKFINQLDTLSANGVGELFCGKSIMNLLAKVPFNENMEIRLESNGSLFNEKNWNKISNLGRHNLAVAITVHSFNEDTYQFLSGTGLPVSNVIQNLYFIKSLRERGIINYFQIATVVCERNFREMPEFVKRCLEFNPDKIRLRFFVPYEVQSKGVEWFYDVRNPHHPYYNEFLKIMKNPIFNHPKVWKWQGETLSDQREDPWLKEHRNYMILSRLICMEHIKIRQYLEKGCIHSFALFGFSQIGKGLVSILLQAKIDFGCIFDSDINLWGREYKGNKILKPTKDNIEAYEAIIITSPVYHLEIKENLLKMGYVGKIINIETLINES